MILLQIPWNLLCTADSADFSNPHRVFSCAINHFFSVDYRLERILQNTVVWSCGCFGHRNCFRGQAAVVELWPLIFINVLKLSFIFYFRKDKSILSIKA